MLVVCDTSPLNYLVQIRQVDLLPRIFAEILVPPAVVQELQHPRSPEAVRLWSATVPAWCHVRSPVSHIDFPGLGRGEVEAINLAREVGASFVLIDERMGSHVATDLGLRVVGTLGVLQRASEMGMVVLPEAIGALAKTNFRASPTVLRALLEQPPPA